MPPAIKTWWYPGNTIGREFIYPKEQAQRLAKRASEPVLTTEQPTTTAEQTKGAALERVSPDGTEAPVAADSKATSSAPRGVAQEGEPAPASIKIVIQKEGPNAARTP